MKDIKQTKSLKSQDLLLKREIKFRHWHLEDNTMYYDSFLTYPRDTEHLHYMQFTGLQDKNGVDVYEGDILKGDLGFMTLSNNIGNLSREGLSCLYYGVKFEDIVEMPLKDHKGINRIMGRKFWIIKYGEYEYAPDYFTGSHLGFYQQPLIIEDCIVCNHRLEEPFIDGCDLEVIGNIFENRELLDN